MFDMYEYYKMINQKNINIIYSGPVWSEGIEGIGGTLRKRLEFDELPLSASQSVFSVFVEQITNILMHSADKAHFETMGHKAIETSRGIFVMGVKDDMYFVQSGNIMKDERVEQIKIKIDHLNTLDKVGLRKYYKEQIKLDNTNKESKGAGLGLIEIARRADAPIEYSFLSIGDGLSFFSMYVTIRTGER